MSQNVQNSTTDVIQSNLIFRNLFPNQSITTLHLILAELLELDIRFRIFILNSVNFENKLPPPHIMRLVQNSQIFQINFDVLQHLSLDSQLTFLHHLFRCHICSKRPCECNISTNLHANINVALDESATTLL